MQIITGRLEGQPEEEPLSRIGERREILALDIETTGLSPEHCCVWLIGCTCWEEGCWQQIQWFDETGRGEADILTSFLLFAKKFSVLLTFNGDRFDLPFLSRRIVHNGLQAMTGSAPFPEGMRSVDLYSSLKPYRQLLSLPDLRQQTLERLIGTGRTEETGGQEQIKLYQSYLENRTEERAAVRAQLLAHNAADMQGLLSLTALLSLEDLDKAELTVYKAQANAYTDAAGTPAQELLMYARPKEPLRLGLLGSITTHSESCYLQLQEEKITIRVPIFRGRLRYYYANYKDYYYLPGMDQAIHKSIASFVEKDHRVQATRETCYTSKEGQFLPQWTKEREPFYLAQYGDKTAWFEFTPELKKDRVFFTEYAAYVYRHILDAVIR